MPIDIPESATEVLNRSKADIQRELQSSNPSGKNHWLTAIVVAFSMRIYDFYLQLNEAIKQNFADTATGDFLLRLAAIWGITQNVATKASGNVVATGTATTSIPINTVLSAASIGTFTTTSAATISAATVNVDSLTRSGTTVTLTTASDHGLATGVSGTIASAANSEYNITAELTVIDTDQVQYEIVGSPADEPATSATLSFTTASVPVESDEFGVDFNLDAGTQLTLQSPITNVDDTLTVDFNGVTGGADTESNASIRSRYLDRIQNPVANFNVAAVEQQAKLISGVTRVFVNEITPAIGQVTIYFMRDNDANPIPNAGQVNTVKNKILEIKPVTNSNDDIIVAAPTAVVIDFNFSDLDPDTSTMRTAIAASLAQFFSESAVEGQNLDEDSYRSAIFNTVDTVTGDIVNTFTLSTPTGDQTVNAGEIATLGNIT